MTYRTHILLFLIFLIVFPLPLLPVPFHPSFHDSLPLFLSFSSLSLVFPSFYFFPFSSPAPLNSSFYRTCFSHFHFSSCHTYVSSPQPSTLPLSSLRLLSSHFCSFFLSSLSTYLHLHASLTPIPTCLLIFLSLSFSVSLLRSPYF